MFLQLLNIFCLTWWQWQTSGDPRGRKWCSVFCHSPWSAEPRITWPTPPDLWNNYWRGFPDYVFI